MDRQKRPKQQKPQKNLNCYACGKPGHIARNCRSKNKVPRMQMNAMRIPRSTVQYWDQPDDWIVNRTLHDEQAIRMIIRQGRRRMDALQDDINSFSVPTRWERQMEEQLNALGDVDTQDDNEDDYVNISDLVESEYEEPESTGSTATEGVIEEQDFTYHANYRRDPRHPHHPGIEDTQCVQNQCPHHDQSYRIEGLTRCHRLWNACRDDTCAYHLADKRHHATFPGHNQAWQRQLRHSKDLPYLRRCQYSQWQYCLNTSCNAHTGDKAEQGFTNDYLSKN